jgi:hypothetical protein
VGGWHDNRHTLVTELADSGAGDEVIMSIAGHASRAMLSRYSYEPDGSEAAQRTGGRSRKPKARSRLLRRGTRRQWVSDYRKSCGSRRTPTESRYSSREAIGPLASAAADWPYGQMIASRLAVTKRIGRNGKKQIDERRACATLQELRGVHAPAC